MADIDEQRSAIDRDTYEMHTAAAPRATLATAQERNRFHAIFTRRSAGGGQHQQVAHASRVINSHAVALVVCPVQGSAFTSWGSSEKGPRC